MIRRRFLELMTLAGVGGLAAAAAPKTTGDRLTVSYKVDGFTCVTCAVGLETVLQREKGVLSAKASYLEGTALITYHPKTTSEFLIAGTIDSMGFKVNRLPSSPKS